MQRRWIAVGGAFVSLFMGPGVHYAFGIMQAELIERRALGTSSRAVVGGAASVSTGLMLLGAYISGFFQDYFGTRRTVMIGAMTASIGLATSAAAREVWHLYISYGLLAGVGHSLQFPPCPVAVARYFEGFSRAGLASGIATSGSGFGAIFLALVLHFVISYQGWRLAFLVLCLATIVSLPPASYAVGGKDPKIKQNQRDSTSKCPPLLIRLALTSGLYGFGWELPFIHGVSYALDKGHSHVAASALVLMIGIGGLVGRVACLALADKIGPGPVLLAVCAATCLAHAILPFLIQFLVFLYFYGFIVGTTAGACIGLTTPLAKAASSFQQNKDIVLDKHDQIPSLSYASGLVYSAMSPGLVAGPILAGYIRDRTGSFDLAFAYAALCWLLALATSFPLRRLRGGDDMILNDNLDILDNEEKANS